MSYIRLFQGNPEHKPQVIKSDLINSLLRGRNLEQDQAYIGEALADPYRILRMLRGNAFSNKTEMKTYSQTEENLIYSKVSLKKRKSQLCDLQRQELTHKPTVRERAPGATEKQQVVHRKPVKSREKH